MGGEAESGRLHGAPAARPRRTPPRTAPAPGAASTMRTSVT